MSRQSADVETRLMQALQRLTGGRAVRCDGRPTRSNLAREAGVSRATLYRHPSILTMFDNATLDGSPPNARTSELEARLAEESETSRRLRGEVRKLESRLRSAVTIILELQANIDESSRGSKVSPLRTSTIEGSKDPAT